MKRYIVLVALFLISCASIPPKQIAAQSLQVSETALGAAQDIERSLCFVNPSTEKGSHCTNPAAAIVNLTDATHVKFAQKFQIAFDIQLKAASEVETWQIGQPQPPGFSTYLGAVQDVLGLAQALVTTNSKAADLVTKAQAAASSAGQIATSFGVK